MNKEKVFVSYTLRDKDLTIEKLQALKRQLPLNCDSFVDIIDNDSEDKQARVERELQKCDRLVQINSPRLQESPWALHEFFEALTRKIPINRIDIKSIKNSKTMAKHKIFISYHHANDQWAKDRLIELNEQNDIFIDCSVDTGDIPEEWDDQKIRTEIRDNYLQDSTVTILLVGTETKNRKHIDWELYSSMFDGTINKKSGIVVILLPSVKSDYYTCSHANEKAIIYPENKSWTSIDSRSEYERRYPCLPERIIDNLLDKNVAISVINWDKLTVDYLKMMIDNAYDSKSTNQYDMSRPMKRKNS